MGENKPKRGGFREGAGRKTKVEELKLAETMDAYCVPSDFWGKVFQLIKIGDMGAIKLWAQYRFGMPQQAVDLTSKGESINNKSLIKLPDGSELEI